jgi:diadenylate cyclase
VADFIDNILFIFQRLTWVSVLDIGLVTLIFFSLLIFLRNSQAIVLIRGIIFLAILVGILINVFDLPAFSWLIITTLPTLLLAVPVIFSPEIRRALERIGRAGDFFPNSRGRASTQDTISSVVHAAERLSSRRHGALIIMQGFDSMEEYIDTGIPMNAIVSPELLLQIFFPNTPLHDGGVIMVGNRISAAGCVMPLSTSGVLSLSGERKMGLRHRAALGSAEVSDCVAVVVSEETGAISIATGSRMIHRLDPKRLESVLRAIYKPDEPRQGVERFIAELFNRPTASEDLSPAGED